MSKYKSDTIVFAKCSFRRETDGGGAGCAPTERGVILFVFPAGRVAIKTSVGRSEANKFGRTEPSPWKNGRTAVVRLIGWQGYEGITLWDITIAVPKTRDTNRRSLASCRFRKAILTARHFIIPSGRRQFSPSICSCRVRSPETEFTRAVPSFRCRFSRKLFRYSNGSVRSESRSTKRLWTVCLVPPLKTSSPD